MAIYRFRVSFEDNEDIYREIEIKSTQTYEDFHNVILHSINFDNLHNASFFISDDLWRKGEEIILHPQKESPNKNRKAETPKREMGKCKMALLIDDPHQKFVYIYDPKTAWTFLIELVKIVLDDAKISYPICAKSVGIAPKQYKKSDEVPVVVEDEEFDDEPHTDDEAYINAHAADEVAELEGEEGEEEVEEAHEEEATEEDDEFGFSEMEDHAEGGDD